MSEGAGQLRFDLFAAEDAKAVGMDLAENAPRVRLWKEAAWSWLCALRSGDEFTADDLVRAVGLPIDEEGLNRNNAVGAWIASQSKARLIVWTGRWSKSERVRQHRADQRIWRKR